MQFVLLLLLAVFLLIHGAVQVEAVSESKLSTLSKSVIMPYFQQHFKKGVMKSRIGGEIRYAESVIADEKGAVVIVDGRTEFMSKYAEVLYDLRNTGFSFYIYDHRGQGESSRLLADPQKGYVKHFNDYVEDLHQFLETVVKIENQRRVFLLSHSMGGPVSILYEREYPGTVSGLILCSPMLHIDTKPYPLVLAKGLAKLLNTVGMGTRYVFGGMPFNPRLPFTNNDLTGSFARFELNRHLAEEDPKVELGAPTIRWLAESFAAMDRIMDHPKPLRLPLLMLSGGEDTVVGNATQKEFCNAQPDCSLVVFPHGRHELLMEKDEVRDAVLKQIRIFLDRHAAKNH